MCCWDFQSVQKRRLAPSPTRSRSAGSRLIWLQPATSNLPLSNFQCHKSSRFLQPSRLTCQSSDHHIHRFDDSSIFFLNVWPSTTRGRVAELFKLANWRHAGGGCWHAGLRSERRLDDFPAEADVWLCLVVDMLTCALLVGFLFARQGPDTRRTFAQSPCQQTAPRLIHGRYFCGQARSNVAAQGKLCPGHGSISSDPGTRLNGTKM